MSIKINPKIVFYLNTNQYKQTELNKSTTCPVCNKIVTEGTFYVTTGCLMGSKLSLTHVHTDCADKFFKRAVYNLKKHRRLQEKH